MSEDKFVSMSEFVFISEGKALLTLSPEMVDLLAKAFAASAAWQAYDESYDGWTQERANELRDADNCAWMAVRDAARAHAQQALGKADILEGKG